MDHGVLNIPLAKRGDIDSQIDAYKAKQAADAAAKRKASAAALRELKAEAKVALAAISSVEGLLEAKAEKLGVTKAKLLAHLESWAKWEPAKLLKAKSEWVPA